MKIKSIVAIPVNIPLEIPLLWTGGLYSGTSKVIAQVFTDGGLVGLGEAPSHDVVDLIQGIGERH